jgi:RNAse (barnase) inhibitor barstar
MIDELVKAAPANGRVIYLDGTRMTTVEALFREYVREFDLPEYFGRNWAAFSECMPDLSWIPAESYLTIIRDSALLLSRTKR